MTKQAQKGFTRIKASPKRINPRKEAGIRDRLRRGLERKLEGRLKSFFVKVHREAARAYLAGRVDSATDKLFDELYDVMFPHYREVWKAFGEQVLRDRGLMKLDWTAYASEWADYAGSKNIQRISTYTRLSIQSIISRGIKDGLGEQAVAKNIVDRGLDISARRAAVIARTETHTASSVATHEITKRYMPEAVKQWVATSDNRTRSAHAEMNGKQVGMDEDFVVNGFNMAYAGDPRGGASNVINCRCSVIYLDPDDFVDDDVQVVEEAPIVRQEPWIRSENIKPNTDISSHRVYDARGMFHSEGVDYRIENGLTKEEANAIFTYTTGEYASINRTMRDWFYGLREVTKEEKAEMIGVHEVLKNGLRKLPAFEGDVCRRVDIPNIARFMRDNKIEKGAIYRAESVFSTTKKSEPDFSGNITYRIKSKQGRYINPMSDYRNEQEVMFLAGHEFKITKVVETGYSLEIFMEDISDEIKNGVTITDRDIPAIQFDTKAKRSNLKKRMQSEIASVDNKLIQLP